MVSHNENRERVTTWLRWGARIWSFPIIIYVLLTLVGYAWNWVTTGVVDPHAVADYPPIENLPPIFMFVSVLGLGIAWRWERWGSIIALVFQAATLVTLFIYRPPMQDFPNSAFPYLLSIIVSIPGILFLICWRRSRKQTPNDTP